MSLPAITNRPHQLPGDTRARRARRGPHATRTLVIAATLGGSLLARPASAGFLDTPQTYEDVVSYMQDAAASNPNVSLAQIGTSWEGRAIYSMKIDAGSADRPAVLLTGAMLGRDWKTTNLVLQLADQITNAACTFDVYFVPIANPDGYAYVWSTDPAWRKNRRASDCNGNGVDDLLDIQLGTSLDLNANEIPDECEGGPPAFGCIGTDLTRNWDVVGPAGSGWGTTPGSAPMVMCSDTYPGSAPFSERETQALRNLIDSTPAIVAHIDYRGSTFLAPYDGDILYPRGQSTLAPLNAGEVLMFQSMAASMAAGGTHRIRALHQLEETAGSMMDWCWDTHAMRSLQVVLEDDGGPVSGVLAANDDTAHRLLNWIAGADDCASAGLVPASNPLAATLVPPFGFDTACATTDGPASCGADNDVWYLYRATHHGWVEIDVQPGAVQTGTTSTPFDPEFAVYAADACPPAAGSELSHIDASGSPLLCSTLTPGNPVSFRVLHGCEYLIRIGGAGALTGHGQLTLTRPGCPPAGPAAPQVFHISGGATGADWNWAIRSTDGTFQTAESWIAGLPVGTSATGIATAFAGSINDWAMLNGCSTISASSSGATLDIDTNGSPFELWVGKDDHFDPDDAPDFNCVSADPCPGVRFLPPVQYVTSSLANKIAMGDLEGDGDLDLVISKAPAAAAMYYNNGNGSFGPEITTPMGPSVRGLEVTLGDLDSDGDLDVAVLLDSPTSVSVLSNNLGMFTPGGSWNTATGFGTSAQHMAMGDLDNDGYLDFVTANNGVNAGASEDASLLFNDQSGLFLPVVRIPLMNTAGAYGPTHVTLGDLDANGWLDIVVTYYETGSIDPVLVLLDDHNTLAGTYKPYVDYQVGDGGGQPAVGDLDGDGYLDIVVPNNHDGTVSVLLNRGNFPGPVGTFDPQVVYGTGRSTAVTLGDVDADGDLDLLLPIIADDSVAVLLNNGNGTFATPVSIDTPAAPIRVTTGDLDGDGDIDLAVTTSGDGTISVLINDCTSEERLAAGCVDDADGNFVPDCACVVTAPSGPGMSAPGCSFNPTITQIILTGTDCNDNGTDDAIDIADGTSLDLDGSGVPDECMAVCAADFDHSGDVGFSDLTTLLANWGPCAMPCPEDLDGDEAVGFSDLTALLSLWGPCAP